MGSAEDWAGGDLHFLIGHPRSGTTFLGRLLGSHSDVAYWEEPELLRFARHLEWVVSQKAAHFLIDGRAPVVAAERDGSLREQFPEGAPDCTEVAAVASNIVRSALNRVHAEFTGAVGKRILLEKSPTQLTDLGYGAMLLPQSKFLHITRDVRDIVCSTFAWTEKWGRPRWLDVDGDLVEAVCTQWRDRVGHVLRTTKTLPEGTVLTLSYEDLVAKPGSVGRYVAAFMGISWEPSMDGFLASGMGGASKRSVGRWLTRLSDEQLATVDQIAGGVMRDLGYGSVL